MRAVAHAHGATVNDVVLAAVAAALHELMASRGEHVDRFVVSIPVAARPMTNVTELGNRVGIVPVDIPATGDLSDRLEAIAATTRSAKKAPRGASASLIGPLFRLLAFMGILNWFINRQHLVNTFVTNLAGPTPAWHSSTRRSPTSSRSPSSQGTSPCPSPCCPTPAPSPSPSSPTLSPAPTSKPSRVAQGSARPPRPSTTEAAPLTRPRIRACVVRQLQPSAASQ